MANITMEKLIAFLKVDLLFACCWPLPPTATKCEKIRNKIFRYFSILHGMIMMIAILYTIYSNRSDLFLIMKLCCELCTTTEVPLQIICFSIQYDRLQYVIYELEDFCKRAKPEERNIFHRYINSCKSIYIGSICAFTVTGLLLIISPIVEPHPFPIDIEYPFSVDYQPLKIIIYLHHILLIYQSYAQVCSNIFIALLLWFVSARCDILSNRFRAVTKFTELRACIEEHQELLWYGRKVTLSIRYVMLASLAVSTIVIIFTGCTFLSFIILEMEACYQRAQEYEKKIFQQYIDKCKLFYGSILCWLAMTGISVILTPLFSSQLFPCEMEYPFDVQLQPLKTIIYVHQILIAYQSVIQVSTNTFPALLLWFVAARFEILSVQFRTMTSMKELVNCTRKHSLLLRYAKEVSHAIRYIALLCVTFSTGAVIFGYLTFMSHQPWTVKWTFLMIAFCGFVELYMYAWPADNVISTSSGIASAVYDSLWYDNNLAIQKILIHIILRSQRPVTISIPCALPNLSMNYYASYISTIFSYMAFVRIMIGQE